MARAWVAAVIACGHWMYCASTAQAQPPAWSVPSYGVNARSIGVATAPAGLRPSGWQAAATGSPTLTDMIAPAPPQAPLARVIKNPDESSGLPPYALADNMGTIQRYVESVPGIDLEPYVGTVVRVRHDTGRTLLASQLDLPPQPLEKLVEAPSTSVVDVARESSADAPPPSMFVTRPARPVKSTKKVIRPVEFVDDDDATVQLLADTEEDLPDGGEVKSRVRSSETVDAMPTTTDDYGPAFPNGIMSNGTPPDQSSMDCDPMYGEPIEMYPGATGTGGDSMNMGIPDMNFEGGMEGSWEVCPQCGGYHAPPGYGGPDGEGWGPACQCQQPKSRFFADVQLNSLRAHLMENFAGKLSENYEFSPRVIVGFDGTGRVDGRARFWHYGRDQRVLNNGGAIRIDFDVLDLEATRTVPVGNSAFLLAAGLRTASLDLVDDDGDSAGCDLLGMTVAADFNTLLCQVERGEFFGVCGARLSILGGDWGQSGGSDFIPSQLQDDNVVVDELYAGVAYATCYRRLDLHAQLGFEMQNWHSDALAQFAGADSISFLGPGIEIGAEF